MMKLLKPMQNQTPSDYESSGEAMPQVMAFLDRFQGVITRLGIDYAQYRLIVGVKLKLANREHVGLGATVNTNKPAQHPLRTSFLLYLVIGVLFAVYLVSGPVFYMLSAYFGILFVMTFLSMLTSFSGMMLDPHDHPIFTVRGVSNRTLNAARLTVVGMYLLLTVAALGLPGLVPIFIRFGILAFLGQLVAVILLALFSFTLALFLYLVVLRYFDGERLKNILNIVQIAMMIGIYVGSQILPRVSTNMLLTSDVTPRFIWYYILVVPMWFAGLPLLAMGKVTLLSVLMSVMAVLVTVVLTGVYAKNAGNFEQYLEKLNNSNGTRHKQGWYFRLTQKLFARSQAERTYFDFGWSIIREEREFKLRVYPQLAYGMIIPIILLFSFVSIGDAMGNSMELIRKFAPYMLLGLFMGIPFGLWSLNFSAQPLAMRLFQRVPLQQHGLLLRGIINAMFARICLPLMLFLLVIFSAVGGVKGFLTSVAMIVLMYALTITFGRMMFGADLPFSQEFSPTNKGGTAKIQWLQMGIMLGVMVIAVAGGFLNSLIYAGAWAVIGVVLIVIMGSSYKNGVHFDVRRV